MDCLKGNSTGNRSSSQRMLGIYPSAKSVMDPMTLLAPNSSSPGVTCCLVSDSGSRCVPKTLLPTYLSI